VKKFISVSFGFLVCLVMAPKETKKDKERPAAKKTEELAAPTEDAPTDGPTDGPTDDDEPDEELLYNAEGALLKPKAKTSAEARAALVATTDFEDSSNADGVTLQEEKVTKRAKRVSARLSRLRSKPKKKRSTKERRRGRRRESSSSSSNDGDSRHRGRSPSSSSCSFSSSSGDSEWEEFYNHDTVVKVRAILKTAPPRAPRDFSKGRFSFEASGEVLFVCKAEKGKKDKWMRESRGRRSDRYADQKGSISQLGHSGNDRVLRRKFGCASSL
jgi:hypothetical protein